MGNTSFNNVPEGVTLQDILTKKAEVNNYKRILDMKLVQISKAFRLSLILKGQKNLTLLIMFL